MQVGIYFKGMFMGVCVYMPMCILELQSRRSLCVVPSLTCAMFKLCIVLMGNLVFGSIFHRGGQFTCAEFMIKAMATAMFSYMTLS